MNTNTPTDTLNGIRRTSLSAGLAVSRMLSCSAPLSALATKIFPVWTSKATLPYVAFRRAELQHLPADPRGADTLRIEVRCYAATYAGSVELAELVRDALDYRRFADEGLRVRAATLTGGEEFMEGDAYVQHLIFTIKI